MGAGIYKNGVAIEVTYQAVNCATGKTVKMDVYDEAHVEDVAKAVAAMTELGTDGRYYGTFTPDAEGVWTVIIENTTDANGKVLQTFRVAGHDVDSLGDALATVDTEIGTVDTVVDGIQTDLSNVTDGLGALKTAIDANATPTEVATELATYDAPTKAELDVLGTAALGTATALATVDTEVGAIQTDLSNVTDGLGAIKDAVDAVGTPAMVG